MCGVGVGGEGHCTQMELCETMGYTLYVRVCVRSGCVVEL